MDWYLAVPIIEFARASMRPHCPLNSVADDLVHHRIVIDRKCLVTGREIEDTPQAAVKCQPAAEHLPALVPGESNDFVSGRNVERFAIHLRLGNLEIGRQTL